MNSIGSSGNSRTSDQLIAIYGSSSLHESCLEIVNTMQELLVHLDLLQCNRASIIEIVAHIVLFFVLDGALQCSDHFALALNKLHFFLDGVKMRIINVLFGTHSLLFYDRLLVHIFDGFASLLRCCVLVDHHLFRWTALLLEAQYGSRNLVHHLLRSGRLHVQVLLRHGWSSSHA